MSTIENNMPIWKAYKIIFRLLLPLHIGYKKMENIQYTRRYIPAKTIWGALTAAIAKKQNNRKYSEIGKTLKSNLRFSYFYLSEKSDGSKPLIPNYSESELKFDGYSIVEFERRFLDSYASTAVLPIYNSAEEESLHEIEILANHVKEEPEIQVFLVGYIFERQNANIPYSWQDALNLIQIGGERKYGFGRLKLISFQPVSATTKLFDVFEFELNEADPKIKLLSNHPFPGHVAISQKNSASNKKNEDKFEKINGENEVLVFRETSQGSRFGYNISNAIITYSPGCTNFVGELKISENLIFEFYEYSDSTWKS